MRFGMTPAVVHDQYQLLADWQRYLEEKLQRPVQFVSRDSYRQTIDLLKEKQIDFAWVSDYPYVYLEHIRVGRLLATPLYLGRPYYRAYLIVPAGDNTTTSILDLKGRVFAYADPYSHTGYMLPRHVLLEAGEDSGRFFRRTYFTWSHRKLVEAVGGEYADGAMVDSFVWDSLARIRPDLTARTRVVARSMEFGFPPIVARRDLDPGDYAAMQQVLMGMARDPVGAKLLVRLNIDGFIRGNERLYQDVFRIAKDLTDR